MLAVLVSYAVGSFAGWIMGVRSGTSKTLDILLDNNFLKTHTIGDTKIIVPMDYEDPTVNDEQ